MKAYLFILIAAMLIAGCAQQAPLKNETPAKNDTTPKNETPVQPPPANQSPPVPPQDGAEFDEDMFSDDLGEALDDLDAVTDPEDLEETGENTYCESDADCWCRVFDGTQFLPGKAGWSCGEGNRCRRCLYY